MISISIGSLLQHEVYTTQIALITHVESESENSCRNSEHIKHHSVRDLKSHILKDSLESGHANVSYYNFKIIAKISVTIFGNAKL